MKTGLIKKSLLACSLAVGMLVASGSTSAWYTHYQTHTCRNGYCQTHVHTRVCNGGYCHYYNRNHYWYR